MKCKVILHSVLRERLPPEARGQAQLELDEAATISDLIHQLGLPEHVVFSVNEELERNAGRVLNEGDVVRFFRPSTGGSAGNSISMERRSDEQLYS